MSLAFIAWMLACSVRAPALLGLWTARLILGRLDPEAMIATPEGIVIGISLCVAASALAILEPAVAKELGEWVRFTGHFAAAMFVVGFVLGLFDRSRTGRR